MTHPATYRPAAAPAVWPAYDGDTVELLDGRTLRIRIESDTIDPFDWSDCWGRVAHIPNRYDGRRDPRPEGFDGAARKVRTGRDAFWWQPWHGATAEEARDAVPRIVDLLAFGLSIVFVEILDGCDAYGSPIVRDVASLGGIEPFADGDYRASIVADLASELGVTIADLVPPALLHCRVPAVGCDDWDLFERDIDGSIELQADDCGRFGPWGETGGSDPAAWRFVVTRAMHGDRDAGTALAWLARWERAEHRRIIAHTITGEEVDGRPAMPTAAEELGALAQSVGAPYRWALRTGGGASVVVFSIGDGRTVTVSNEQGCAPDVSHPSDWIFVLRAPGEGPEGAGLGEALASGHATAGNLVSEVEAFIMRHDERAYGDYVAACEVENLDAHPFGAWRVHGRPSGPLG